MSKIAHLKVTCPQCEEETSIYVVEDGGSGAKILIIPQKGKSTIEYSVQFN